MMIGGYLTVMVVALVPPLWHWLMTPKLLAWDRDFADAGEWHLARAANAASGISLLERAAREVGGSDRAPSGAPRSTPPQSSRGQSEASSVSR